MKLGGNIDGGDMRELKGREIWWDSSKHIFVCMKFSNNKRCFNI